MHAGRASSKRTPLLGAIAVRPGRPADDAETIGTMNLLDAEHHYKPDDVPKVHCLAPLLIPAIMTVRSGGQYAQLGR